MLNMMKLKLANSLQTLLTPSRKNCLWLALEEEEGNIVHSIRKSVIHQEKKRKRIRIKLQTISNQG